MRWIRVTLAALLLAGPVVAQEEMDADREVAGGGALAEGWMGRTDRGQDFTNVKFTEEAGVLEISVGPGLVLYRPEDTASGTYTVSGTFRQLSAKGHGHGVGLIIGGAGLQGPNQVYTYFLVRSDGAFLVKTRTGGKTAYLTRWTKSAAVHEEDESGDATNEMSVEVGAESVIFKLNGQEVHRENRADIYTDGVWGVRLNHNLDMRISDLAVQSGG